MKGPLIYYDLKDMYDSHLDSKKTSIELRQHILDDIDLGFNVEIDFKDITMVTKDWAKNTFGSILKSKGSDFIQNHISLINMNKIIQKVILKEIKKIPV